MELLLVTPLGERRIISGRLAGIRGQFRASAFLLLGLWLYAALFFGANLIWFAFFAVTFWVLPEIGLFFSLRHRHRVVALVWTIVVGLALPLLINSLALSFGPENLRNGLVTFFGFHPVSDPWRLAMTGRLVLRKNDLPDIISSTLVPMAVQMAMATWMIVRLRRNLERRRFAFQRA
jgi:hypothetical protein